VLPLGRWRRGRGARLACAAALLVAMAACAAAARGPARLEVSADVVDRNAGACTLCHAVPGERIYGNLAPGLAGVGARLTAAQLRLRVADSTRLDAGSAMPAYFRTEGLKQVAAAYRGKTILSAQQVEDVVAYLATLK
jgi:L-cysteine S-thiosulfotransferase